MRESAYDANGDMGGMGNLSGGVEMGGHKNRSGARLGSDFLCLR